jgi:hypothetical protein
MSEVGSLEWTMEFAKELRTRIETADKAGYEGIFEADGRDVAMLYSEIERLRKAVFMAHAELGEGSACGCGCDDCKAYITDGSSEPQSAPHDAKG